MSFAFRGSRGDLESGFADFIPERRNVRFHGNGRSINTNSMAFLVTVLLLFMILNSHQMSPNFLLWLGMGIFLMATGLRVYAICQQLQAQAQAHAAAAAAAAGGLVGHTEFRLRMPPSIAFATRGRLQGLRLQLALLDREFDDLDYDALRALDGDNPPGVASLSDTEINALPLHKHKAPSTGYQPARSLSLSLSLSLPKATCINSKAIEDEAHVLLQCPAYAHIRARYEFLMRQEDGIYSLLNKANQKTLGKYITEVLTH